MADNNLQNFSYNEQDSPLSAVMGRKYQDFAGWDFGADLSKTLPFKEKLEYDAAFPTVDDPDLSWVDASVRVDTDTDDDQDSNDTSTEDAEPDTYTGKASVRDNVKISTDRKNFLNTNAPIISRVAEEFGINPYFILAMTTIETGYGITNNYRNHNVLFNITGTSKDKTVTGGDKNESGERIVQNFKSYDSAEESVRDFCRWVKRRPELYKIAQSSDVDAIAEAMSKSGFATGTGATQEERQSKLKNNYKSVMSSLKKWVEF
jgi:hypothetical protein